MSSSNRVSKKLKLSHLFRPRQPSKSMKMAERMAKMVSAENAAIAQTPLEKKPKRAPRPRPFQCSKCIKTFVQKDACNKHQAGCGAPPFTGTADLLQVERAITFKGGAIAWAIQNGHKIVENRRFRIPKGWYALHVGEKNTLSDEDVERYRRECAKTGGVLPNENDIVKAWKGKVVGCFRVSEHRAPGSCGSCVWASGPQCNVIDAVVRLKTPVQAKGALSYWFLSEAERAVVREQLSANGACAVHIEMNDLSGLPELAPAGPPPPPMLAAASGKKRLRTVSEVCFQNNLLGTPLQLASPPTLHAASAATAVKTQDPAAAEAIKPSKPPKNPNQYLFQRASIL